MLALWRQDWLEGAWWNTNPSRSMSASCVCRASPGSTDAAGNATSVPTTTPPRYDESERLKCSVRSNISRPLDVFLCIDFFFFFKWRTMTKYVLASSLLFGYLELFPHRGSLDTSGSFPLVCRPLRSTHEDWVLVTSCCLFTGFSFGRLTAMLCCKCCLLISTGHSSDSDGPPYSSAPIRNCKTTRWCIQVHPSSSNRSSGVSLWLGEDVVQGATQSIMASCQQC